MTAVSYYVTSCMFSDTFIVKHNKIVFENNVSPTLNSTLNLT